MSQDLKKSEKKQGFDYLGERPPEPPEAELKPHKPPKPPKRRKIFKFIFKLIFLVILIAAGYLLSKTKSGVAISDKLEKFVQEKIVGSEGEVVTDVETTIKSVLNKSELYTSDCVFNSIATVCDEKGNIKYYIYYKGHVYAGIDFDKISIKNDSESKIVTIVLPKVEVKEVSVDSESMSYIFRDESYNNEDTFQKAYSICLEDLKAKAEKDEKLFSTTTTSARSAVETLTAPWSAQNTAGYTVIVE